MLQDQIEAIESLALSRAERDRLQAPLLDAPSREREARRVRGVTTLVKRDGAYYTPCGKVMVVRHAVTKHGKRPVGVGGSTIRKSRTYRWYSINMVGTSVWDARHADDLASATIAAFELAKVAA
jgi:hypothetical protein